MPQIEDVSGARVRRAERGQRLADFPLDARVIGEKYQRVQIALQRAASTNAGPRGAQIDRPVQPHRVAAGLGNQLQPKAATLGKDYCWYALTFVLSL